MAKSDSYLKMTGDDLRAARVLTLAVKFFGTNHPVAASTIRSELYTSLDDGSFKRQFLRDRDLLASLGLVITEVESSDTDTLWQVNEQASFVQGDGLSAKDARMLYVLCYDMAYDQAFPYRDELRIALAKISRMYRGMTFPHTDTSSPSERKLLAVLISCMSNHRAAAVTYTDAQGNTSDRTLALLGSFGLRNKTYFVASRVNKDGSLVDDSVRTYRLDRFGKAREVTQISYRVPLDFSVSDYERLPFQIGDPCGKARFAITDKPGKHLTRALETHGSTCDDDAQRTWEVSYSDVDAVAAWAVAAGITPLEPQAICDRWTQILTEAAQTDICDPSLINSLAGAYMQTSRRRAGRTGSISLTRQLIALASSLTREGEVITAQDIANTLGVSFDEARHLIALVSMGSGESIDYLPVILGDEDEEVSLMEGAALSARRVRLTRAETIALVAALAELGIDDKDPLVQTLTGSYGAPSFSAEDIAQSLEAPSSTTDVTTLRQCSHAISNGRGITFVYRPVTGGAPSRRRVVPQLVRRTDDIWYLDAFDLVRQGTRVFRIDRMSDVSEIPAPAVKGLVADKTPSKTVVARFSDRRYLDLFYWEGLQVIDDRGPGIVVSMPYYGGTWLARHLAACGANVQVSDSELAQITSDYARGQLRP